MLTITIKNRETGEEITLVQLANDYGFDYVDGWRLKSYTGSLEMCFIERGVRVQDIFIDNNKYSFTITNN